MKAGSEQNGLTVAILAGGRASRMQGYDKASLQLGGQSLLQRALTVLRPQTARQMIISSHEYRGLGVPVRADAWPGQPGPLAGIYTGLLQADAAEVLFVAGDAPLIPPDLVARLRTALQRERKSAACVHDGSGIQPLFCLVPAGAAESARHALAAGQWSVQRWLQDLQPALADFSDWPQWGWSVNTPEEWAQVQAKAA